MSSQHESISRGRAWLMAARPQTLPAAASPVIVGTGVAVSEGVFALGPAFMAFVGAALIQIGTNLANDYFDAVKGTDTPNREGFTRVTATGLIDPVTVRRATVLTFSAAILVGTYLVYIGGLPILIVGLVSIAAGIAYTGGPYPLGYHGLGDVFVFIFFGLIAVTGTVYVQAAATLADPLLLSPPAETLSWLAVLASLPVAALSTNILVVNNIRDLEEDERAGKHTLAVRFGYRVSRMQFTALLVMAYAVPPILVAIDAVQIHGLLPLLTLPYGGQLTRTIWQYTDGAHLNPALEQAGRLLAAFAILFALGVAA